MLVAGEDGCPQIYPRGVFSFIRLRSGIAVTVPSQRKVGYFPALSYGPITPRLRFCRMGMDLLWLGEVSLTTIRLT